MDSTEIIEKIRAEIKIRLSANGAFDEEGDSAWHYDQGLNDAYNYILSFLSDLEKSEKPINHFADAGKMIEQPACEELEDDSLRVEFKKIDHQCFEEGVVGWQKEKLIARHFYELGLNARKEE